MGINRSFVVAPESGFSHTNWETQPSLARQSLPPPLRKTHPQKNLGRTRKTTVSQACRIGVLCGLLARRPRWGLRDARQPRQEYSPRSPVANPVAGPRGLAIPAGPRLVQSRATSEGARRTEPNGRLRPEADTHQSLEARQEAKRGGRCSRPLEAGLEGSASVGLDLELTFLWVFCELPAGEHQSGVDPESERKLR